MTPKFTKADAYRTDKTIVSLCNIYEGQYIIKDMEKLVSMKVQITGIALIFMKPMEYVSFMETGLVKLAISATIF